MKRLRQAVIALMVVFGLASCQSDERAITASFGVGVVTGQVVLGGELEGSSPAGIEVSVPRTGIEATLTEDGRFLLSGVPEDLTLRFRRSSDGIDVTYRTGLSGGADLVVELDRGSARSGRRRATFKGAIQLEGLILEVSADSLTLDAAGRGATTVSIDERTHIRKGNRPLTTDDLAVGDRVHVSAQDVDDVLVARVIKLQNDDDERLQKVELEGLILSISDSEIVVDAAGRGPTTAAIDEATWIRQGKSTLTVADLRVGDRVHVRAVTGDSGLRAIEIRLQKGDEDGVRGKVEIEGLILEVGDGTIRVDGARQGPVDVLLDEATEIRKGNRNLEPTDLQPGWRVHVRARNTGDSLLALLIIVQNTSGGDDDDEEEESDRVELEGLIVEVSDTSITVDAAGKGETTATITADTVIRKGNTLLDPSDLKEGDRVHVKAEKDGEELVAIEILLQKPA